MAVMLNSYRAKVAAPCSPDQSCDATDSGTKYSKLLPTLHGVPYDLFSHWTLFGYEQESSTSYLTLTRKHIPFSTLWFTQI